MVHNLLLKPDYYPRRHETLYKPSIEGTKGSTTNRYIAASQEHRTVFLVFNMNGMPLLHTKSYEITFLTAEFFHSKSADKIIK